MEENNLKERITAQSVGCAVILYKMLFLSTRSRLDYSARYGFNAVIISSMLSSV